MSSDSPGGSGGISRPIKIMIGSVFAIVFFCCICCFGLSFLVPIDDLIGVFEDVIETIF